MNRKPVDLAKIREGDELMREARRLDPNVRLPTLSELKRILPMSEPTGKKTGRPKGEEPTVTIALRIPESMCVELDAHVERLESNTGLKASRTAVCRHALKVYLAEDPVLSESKTTSAKATQPKATAPKRTRTPAKAAKG